MKQISLEVFSETTNAPVIRMAGRKYPGVLIQGDSLSILYNTISEIQSRLASTPTHDPDIEDLVNEVKQALESPLQDYQAILDAHGIQLPFERFQLPSSK